MDSRFCARRFHQSRRAKNCPALTDQLRIGLAVDQPYGIVPAVNRVAIESHWQRPPRPKLFVQALEHRLGLFDMGIGVDDHRHLIH